MAGRLNSDIEHGNRGGGPLHTTATKDVAGFMSAADKAALDDLVAGGGGGGGSGDMLKSVYDTNNDGVVNAAASAPWSGLTGVPASFPPSAHTHPQSDVTNLTTDLAAKAVRAWGSATVTIPGGAGVLSYSQSFADVSVSPSSVVELMLQPAANTDENDPELLDLVTMVAAPASGSFTVSMTFSQRTSGNVKVIYRVN